MTRCVVVTLAPDVAIRQRLCFTSRDQLVVPFQRFGSKFGLRFFSVERSGTLWLWRGMWHWHIQSVIENIHTIDVLTLMRCINLRSTYTCIFVSRCSPVCYGYPISREVHRRCPIHHVTVYVSYITHDSSGNEVDLCNYSAAMWLVTAVRSVQTCSTIRSMECWWSEYVQHKSHAFVAVTSSRHNNDDIPVRGHESCTAIHRGIDC